MKVVIDIPDDMYSKITDSKLPFNGEPPMSLVWAVKNGTPLPKGHGDLIDLNELKYGLRWVGDYPDIKLNDQALEIWKEIDATKTVIPADKGE